MTTERKYFISLSRAAIFDETPPAPPDGLDWQWLWEKSREQNLTGLLASAIEKLPNEQRPTNYEQWYTTMLQTAMVMGDRFDEFERMMGILRQNGLEVIALKGVVLKDLYGEGRSTLRTMGDFDVFVKKEKLSEIQRIFATDGYTLTDERTGLTASKDAYSWDIFYTLEEEFRDKSGKYDEIIRNKAIKINGLTCPCPTYMLAHLLLHLGKHLTSEGAGLRNLLDIALFVKAYKNEIDFKEVRNVCQELDFKNIYIYALNALNKYFDFDFDIEAKDPKKFVALMLDGGIFGEGKSNVLLAQVSKRGDISVYRKLFFPPASMLEESYKYLQKFPFLLPVAWVHRFFYAVFHRKFGVKKMLEDIEGSVEFAKKHDKTMEELGL